MSSRSISLARRLLPSLQQRRPQSTLRALHHRDILLSSRQQQKAAWLSHRIPRTQAPVLQSIAARHKSSAQPRPSNSTDVVSGAAQSGVTGQQEDHLSLAKPLDFDVASKVDGQESQMVTFDLDPGQVIRVSKARKLDPLF